MVGGATSNSSLHPLLGVMGVLPDPLHPPGYGPDRGVQRFRNKKIRICGKKSFP